MSESSPLILVVDDDPALQRIVSRALELEGFRVLTAEGGQRALQLMEDENPALVLLDVMMPGINGFQVCERIRDFSNVPIVMLTARGQVDDVVKGLDAGADDYIVKPFDTGELVVRVEAVLRRSRPQATAIDTFSTGDLFIDFRRRVVTEKGVEIALTATEYKLLWALATNAGRQLTPAQLLSEVWGEGSTQDLHVLQVTLARLRKKIQDDTSNPRYIFTRQGVGYVFASGTRRQ